MATTVCWIFSLPRSGTSVTAYASAEAMGHSIADEVLGPWDRTGEPYFYPPLQRRLCEAYIGGGCRLGPDVVAMARDLFAMLDTGTGVVIAKHPHLRPTPDEFRAAFPDHHAIWLMRNPLKRVNSLVARRWTSDLRPNFELERFREFAASWRAQPQRVQFEAMRHDPAAYFHAVWTHWGWTFDHASLHRAVLYARDHYHANSKERASDADASDPLSERRWHLPDEAVALYRDDPHVRACMESLGYSVEPSSYRSEQSLAEIRAHRLAERLPTLGRAIGVGAIASWLERASVT